MKGWFLVAFERDIERDVWPVNIGERRFILVKRQGALRAFDATCPHRGAHLGGGCLLGDDAIRCPFHGYSICLGVTGTTGLSIAEYSVLNMSGMVFVRMSATHDNGWTAFLRHLDESHWIVNGFEMTVQTLMETVIENAFDHRHFHAVHGVRTDDFVVHPNENGALEVESTFYVPGGARSVPNALVPARYRAYVASPGVTAVTLSGPVSYTVITGATDLPSSGCLIRLTLAFPKAVSPSGPPVELCETLLRHSRRGLEEDSIIWESLAPNHSPAWTSDDRHCLDFMSFCQSHRDD